MKNTLKEKVYILSCSILFTTAFLFVTFYSIHAISGYTWEETNEEAYELLYQVKKMLVGTEEETYTNHRIARLMNKQSFEGPKNYEPVVCFWDSSQGNHHKQTIQEAMRYYTGDYRFFDRLEMKADIKSLKAFGLLECDIINYSMGIDTSFNEASVEYHRSNALELLKEWDGLFIASAGNTQGEDTIFLQPFSWVKQVHPEYRDNIIVVGQLTTENGELINESAYGEQIDIMVPNGSFLIPEGRDHYRTNSGTSFASPTVTAVSANLMSRYGRDNIPLIREKIIQQPNQFTEHFGERAFSYPLMDIGNSYKH